MRFEGTPLVSPLHTYPPAIRWATQGFHFFSQMATWVYLQSKLRFQPHFSIGVQCVVGCSMRWWFRT